MLLSRFTCDECVEGMEFVEAYMRDPLWVAEYTLYLEQNFCVHDQVSSDCVVYNNILHSSKGSRCVILHLIPYFLTKLSYKN